MIHQTRLNPYKLIINIITIVLLFLILLLLLLNISYSKPFNTPESHVDTLNSLLIGVKLLGNRSGPTIQNHKITNQLITHNPNQFKIIIINTIIINIIATIVVYTIYNAIISPSSI